MRAARVVAVLAATVALAACGSVGDPGEDPTATTTGTTAADPTAAVVSTTAPSPATTATTITTTTTGSTGTSTSVVTERQQAIWPAAGVVFTTPETVAENFVSTALRVPPALGPFAQGDARSGEIDVFLSGEDGQVVPVVKSTLVLRQLGPSDGWFVLAAASDNATISTPIATATVPRGPLTVEGRARGFEAAVKVSASLAGHAEVLDSVSTLAGSAETPEPYRVTLDLSNAQPGDVVMLLVQGGTGLETDPGDFGAIPVMIG